MIGLRIALRIWIIYKSKEVSILFRWGIFFRFYVLNIGYQDGKMKDYNNENLAQVSIIKRYKICQFL